MRPNLARIVNVRRDLDAGAARMNSIDGGVYITNCKLSGYTALEMAYNTFTGTVSNCQITPPDNDGVGGTVGIYSGSATAQAYTALSSVLVHGSLGINKIVKAAGALNDPCGVRKRLSGAGRVRIGRLRGQCNIKCPYGPEARLGGHCRTRAPQRGRDLTAR
jgi:hypothetical protein